MERINKIIFDKNTIWYGIGSALYSFVSIIIVIFFTNFYPSQIYLTGIFSFAFYISSVFSTIGNYGGRIVQTSDYNNRYLSGDYIGLKLLMSSIMLVIALFFVIINSYDIYKISLVISFLLYRFLENISDSIYGILQKNNNLELVGKSLFIKSLLSMIFFIIMYILTENLIISSISFLFCSFFILLLYDIKNIIKYDTIRMDISRLSKIIVLAKESFPIFIVSFVSLAFMNVSRYFADLKFSTDNLSIFSLIILPSSLIILFYQFIVQPFVMKLTNIYNNKPKIEFYTNVIKIVYCLSIFGLIISFLSYFLGPIIMKIIFSIDFSKFSLAFFLVVLSGICAGISLIISFSLTIIHKYKPQMIGQVISLIIYILLSIVIIKNSFNQLILSYFLGFFIQSSIMMTIFLYIKRKELSKNNIDISNNRLAQINSVCNGSTGKIMGEIQRKANNTNFDTISFFGRRKEFKDIKCNKFCNQLSVIIHVVMTFIFNNHGCGSYFSTKRLIKKIKKFNPNIIQLHNIHGYYLNYPVLFNYFKKEYKGKVFWTFHDCWPFTGHCAYFDFVKCDNWRTECKKCPQIRKYPISLFFDTSTMEYYRKKKIFNGVKDLTIVTPSDWLNNLTKESFLNEYPVKTINNGIDLKVFFPNVGENINEKYNIPKNKKIILGIANVWEERKGIEDFYKLSKSIKNDVIIVLVGVTEKQKNKLPKNILGIPRTDNQKELVNIYSISDVFVNPTREDNYPTVNLEAIACGTPVVTYNVGGCKEQIIGNVGYVCNDFDDLKNKIFFCLKNEYKKNKFNNSKSLKNINSTKKYEEYINLYTKE